MDNAQLDKESAVRLLNRILELELAGVVRYTHYSFMVHGDSRIPIVSWLRGEASTSLAHAHEAGELLEEYARRVAPMACSRRGARDTRRGYDGSFAAAGRPPPGVREARAARAQARWRDAA